jgi:hypothetical protein
MRACPGWLGRAGFAALVLAAVVSVPAAGALDVFKAPTALLDHVSQSVALNYYAAHRDQAPDRIAQGLSAVKTPPGRHVSSCTANANKDAFNCDIFGLPQNEESVGACPTNDNFVLEGDNDYRGLIDPEGNFTGWDWSVDGGHSVKNEGLLPPVALTKIAAPHQVPSGGDRREPRLRPELPVHESERARDLQEHAADPVDVPALHGCGVHESRLLAGTERCRAGRDGRLHRQAVDVRRHAKRRPLRVGDIQ